MDNERIHTKKSLILESMVESIFTMPVILIPISLLIPFTIGRPKLLTYLSAFILYILNVIILFYMQKASDYKKVYYEHLETIRALRYELKDKNRECEELKEIIDAARKKAGN